MNVVRPVCVFICGAVSLSVCHSLNRFQLHLAEYFSTYIGGGVVACSSWIAAQHLTSLPQND